MAQCSGLVPTKCCFLYLVTSCRQTDNRLICLMDGHLGNRHTDNRLICLTDGHLGNRKVPFSNALR
ncbi:hypothetical protein DPMN_123624 [Dreissena polymorpha]|uniref:Uncharacterized protein n=1 Tax=Dreissena polymorpha TaxID=45954 RepID=A0A9D4JRQ0_DREPO|nr:hypothetical protein DPMN_123624 [Dreissena polymorpha]